MSVARGFQYAGAQNVLFSLWEINDFTTAEIMCNFYENCNKNESYFNANYNSKINFLENKNISNLKKSPYYWAAFVYYGEVHTNTTHGFVWFIVGFCVLYLFYICFIPIRHKNSLIYSFFSYNPNSKNNPVTKAMQ